MADALLLYDGHCLLCRRWAGWVGRHDTLAKFQLEPYQDADVPKATKKRLPKAVHLMLADGGVLFGARAVIHVHKALGWWWVTPLGWPPLVWLAQLGYGILSRNRARFAPFLFRGQVPAPPASDVESPGK